MCPLAAQAGGRRRRLCVRRVVGNNAPQVGIVVGRPPPRKVAALVLAVCAQCLGERRPWLAFAPLCAGGGLARLFAHAPRQPQYGVEPNRKRFGEILNPLALRVPVGSEVGDRMHRRRRGSGPPCAQSSCVCALSRRERHIGGGQRGAQRQFLGAGSGAVRSAGAEPHARKLVVLLPPAATRAA